MASLPPIDQQKYINKLYAVAVERCMPLITEEEAAQVQNFLFLVFSNPRKF